MDGVPNIPNVPVPVTQDPVQRSIAKPDAFSKPGSFTAKPAAKSAKPTRIRTMDWKRGRGRPRVRPVDRRKVKFF